MEMATRQAHQLGQLAHSVVWLAGLPSAMLADFDLSETVDVCKQEKHTKRAERALERGWSHVKSCDQPLCRQRCSQ